MNEHFLYIFKAYYNNPRNFTMNRVRVWIIEHQFKVIWVKAFLYNDGGKNIFIPFTYFNLPTNDKEG